MGVEALLAPPTPLNTFLWAPCPSIISCRHFHGCSHHTPAENSSLPTSTRGSKGAGTETAVGRGDGAQLLNQTIPVAAVGLRWPSIHSEQGGSNQLYTAFPQLLYHKEFRKLILKALLGI